MGPGPSLRAVGALLAQCGTQTQTRLPAVLLPLAGPQLLQVVKMCTQPMASQQTVKPPSFTPPPPHIRPDPLATLPNLETPTSSVRDLPRDPEPAQPAASASSQKEGSPPGSNSSSYSDNTFGGNNDHGGGAGGRDGDQSGEAGSGPGTSGQAAGAGENSQSSGSSGWAHAGAHQYFERLRAGLGGFMGFAAQGLQGAPPLKERAASLVKAAAQEMVAAVLPREESVSVTRVYQGGLAKPVPQEGGPGELVPVKKKQSSWEKVWGEWQEKFGHHPLFRRLSGLKVGDTPALRKGQEVVADLKERYENSDHPFVHKVEDMKERFFAQNEAARAVQEIRSRDPSFDMNKFIRQLRADAPRVVQAFLTRDLETLKQHCGPELQERFAGIFKNFDHLGLYDDPTILFTSDVELSEIHMVEDDPMVVVQFNCQQLRCTRDKFGNVVDGSTDSIQRVFYFWGLQQEREGVVTAEGKVLPPRWVIKDMMWKSMQALV